MSLRTGFACVSSVRLAAGLLLAASCFASAAGHRVAEAGSIVATRQFDFRTGNGRSADGGWTASHSGGGPVAERWRWVGSSNRNTGRWSQAPSSASRRVDRGNYLTSPVIDVESLLGKGADSFRITLAQRFDFDRLSNGQPLSAGQIAYSLDGGRFVPIPNSAYAVGNKILSAEFNDLPSPFATARGIVNPKAGFVAPRNAASGSPALLPGGGLFTGRSLGYLVGAYVPTEAILDFSDIGTSFKTIQFRLIGADFASKAKPNSRWDVRYFRVDVAAPEPSGIVLAGIGCAATLWGLRRRGRSAARSRGSRPATPHRKPKQGP